MKDELKYIFSNVNDWLKFAETKHAALITFNAAAIFGVLQLFDKYKANYKSIVIIILILFSVSILISLYSFIPVLTTKCDSISDNEFLEKQDTLNVLFFKDLHNLNENQVLVLLNYKMNTNVVTTKLEQDLAKQIINNARLTTLKFHLSKVGGFITWIAIFIFATLFFAMG